MKVYLVQHAKSKPEEEDPQKPLSEQGRNDATKVAGLLKNVDVKKVYHSGKLRAQQTAEIFAKSLNAEVIKVEGLDPMADPTIWAERLEKESKDVMLVGHLPHLAKLASILICQQPDKHTVTFQQGGVVCLVKTTGWSMAWMVIPELVH